MSRHTCPTATRQAKGPATPAPHRSTPTMVLPFTTARRITPGDPVIEPARPRFSPWATRPRMGCRRRDQGQRTGHRQQEPRSVSASPAGPRSQVTRCAAPDAYSFADDPHGLSRLRLRALRSQWSRPMHTDGCSMFARMPRYAPAASGIRSAPRIPAIGQKWQIPACASIA